jgi:hypothetical protein
MTLEEYYRDIMYEVVDGSYYGNIDLTKYKDTMTSLPDFSSINVVGSFNISSCKRLTSLKGSPAQVTLNYNCNFCDNLENLEGCTQNIGGTFFCQGELKSIKGFPVNVFTYYRPSRFSDFEVYVAQNIKKINTYEINESTLYKLINLLIK